MIQKNFLNKEDGLDLWNQNQMIQKLKLKKMRMNIKLLVKKMMKMMRILMKVSMMMKMMRMILMRKMMKKNLKRIIMMKMRMMIKRKKRKND